METTPQSPLVPTPLVQNQKHLSKYIKIFAGVLVIGLLLFVLFGKNGLYKGSLGDILTKTTLTEDLCKQANGAWSTNEQGESSCTYDGQIYAYLEDIQQAALKKICQNTADATWSDSGCAFAGQTYNDDNALKQAVNTYTVFKMACANAGGAFADNKCAISIAGASLVLNSADELNAKLFKKECDTASGTFDEAAVTCSTAAIGTVKSIDELKTRQLQVLCVDAKTISNTWTEKAATWIEPGTCEFLGQQYTNYTDLSKLIASVKISQEVCANGDGVFKNNQCSLDNTKLLQALCQKKFTPPLITAANSGTRWNANSTCTYSYIFNPAKVFQAIDTAALNDALKKGKATLEDFYSTCTSNGGSIPNNTSSCIYNNTIFYFYSVNPSLKSAIEANAKTAALQTQLQEKDAQAREAAEKADQEKALQDAVNQAQAQKEQEMAALRAAAERANAEQIAAQERELQTLRDKLNSAEKTQNTIQIDSLTKQINDLKDRLTQTQTQATQTVGTTAPVVAPIICADPSLVYDPKLKGCLAPTVAPTITAPPTAKKTTTTTKPSTTTKKTTTTKPSTTTLKKSAPTTQFTQEQIEAIVKAVILQLQAAQK